MLKMGPSNELKMITDSCSDQCSSETDTGTHDSPCGKTNEDRTLNELRNERRIFHIEIQPLSVGYAPHEAQAEAIQRGIFLTRCNTDEVSWKTLKEDKRDNFWKAVETE